VPLASHAEVHGQGARADAVTLLAEQAAARLPDLVPIRYGRMLVSPFAFLRGAARVMAADLATTANSGLVVQMCGDAHLANFGLFGSPERRLVFDANDFDETLPGPFEYDVKRLVASLAVAGRDNGYTRKQRKAVVLAAAGRYRTAMAEFATMRDLDVWYSSTDTAQLEQQLLPHLDARRRKRLRKAFEKARTRDSLQAFGRMTESRGGRVRIRPEPPLLVPLRDLVPGLEGDDLEPRFRALIEEYRGSLEPDRQVLLERYHVVDLARKVVGVGSVGTRCWIVLLTGRDDGDPLFLQIKEAGPSVHAEFLGDGLPGDGLPGDGRYGNQGRRVVTGQRLMQQAGDVFLGWQRTTGIDGVERDFYIRQLHDWKGSLTVDGMPPDGMRLYGEVCGWSLARAHARSGDRIAIAGYLGAGQAFDRALVEYAEGYADVTERDHAALSEAVASGRLVARHGL
jgi:uncharacterized protein (DUF2252 family)